MHAITSSGRKGKEKNNPARLSGPVIMLGIILASFAFLIPQEAFAADETFTKLGQFPGGAVYVIAMKGDTLDLLRN